MKIIDKLPKPFFALAPLDDVSDTVFRRIIAGCAKPDLLFTEFTNVDALQSAGREATLRRLDFDKSEEPIIAQIWGKNPENFKKTTEECAARDFAGVDLNMGCPIKHVVKNGCCSALINDRDKAKIIIDSTKAGLGKDMAFSVKTRLGFSGVDLSWIEFLLKQNPDMLIIHLRTVKEMSKVPAHWDLMPKIKRLRDEIAPDTLLVGNGDVADRNHGEVLAEKYGIDGIMIGRGIFHDPFAFSKETQWAAYEPLKRLKLYEKQVRLFKTVWKNNERPIVTLNKFCKIYVNGFSGAKEMREDLMHAVNSDDLLEKIRAIKDRLVTDG
ncbi:MAG TPA: tRNA-dihydrouridine synthase [Candidatus Saccharimonadales bacterium]|nr:tRNA-dihydrouridine synthase [Candidatus Saccharimonadales bacterium]